MAHVATKCRTDSINLAVSTVPMYCSCRVFLGILAELTESANRFRVVVSRSGNAILETFVRMGKESKWIY